MQLQKLQPVLFALIFTIGSVGVLAWMFFGVTTFGEELRERIETIKNQHAFENQFNELESMVTETEEQRERLTDFILEGENETIGLLSRFDAVAAAHDVAFATRELSVVEGTDKYDDLALSFSITGDVETVMKMIRMFETLPYHGHITSLGMERGTDQATGETTLDADIALLLTIRNYDQ